MSHVARLTRFSCLHEQYFVSSRLQDRIAPLPRFIPRLVPDETLFTFRAEEKKSQHWQILSASLSVLSDLSAGADYYNKPTPESQALTPSTNFTFATDKFRAINMQERWKYLPLASSIRF